jgi:hypothetical protein
MGVFDVQTGGGQWNVCTRQTFAYASSWFNTGYGAPPKGTMWVRAWVHETRNAAGQVISSWSPPTAWVNEAIGPQWTFSPTYYPDKFAVQFMFVTPYNQVLGNVTLTDNTESILETYFHCAPPGGWKDVYHTYNW